MTTLESVCQEHGILALYLFGSRAGDGVRAVLRGETVGTGGSDLDIGVVFESHQLDPVRLGPLQAALEEVFEPLRVDLVPLQRVDALFQYAAVDGHRVFAGDSTKADLYELEVLRRAAELLPIQRRLERETFGVSTT